MSSSDTLHDLGDGHWLRVLDVGGSRCRLEVYRQEEELAPPFLLNSIPSTPRQVRALLVVIALSDRSVDPALCEVARVPAQLLRPPPRQRHRDIPVRRRSSRALARG